MGFVLQQAARHGYGLRALTNDLDTLDPSVWDDHLGEEVCLVLITHLQSNTGRQVPVAEICAAAHAKGISTIVDIAQPVGVIPMDLEAWRADFALGSCVKWLCGGPGAGFPWIDAERLAECEPADVGWFSHENPFEFDIHDFRYAGDALRFWGGPVVLNFPDARREAVCTRLREGGVGFDVRPTVIRLSPHTYDDSDEITGVLALP
jgi:kynureninase